MNPYAEAFTWSHPLGEHAIAHRDGAVSCVIGYRGWDVSLATDAQRAALWTPLYQALHSLPPDVVAEWHLWREHDTRWVDEYLSVGSRMQRGAEVAQPFREAMADHLAQYTLINETALVLTHVPRKRPFWARRALVEQARAADTVCDTAHALLRFLPEARLLSVDDFVQRIVQSASRRRFLRGARTTVDPRFLLNEQLLDAQPSDSHNGLAFEGEHTRALLVYLYPKCEPGWTERLARAPCPLHLSHIVQAADTRRALREAERDGTLSEGLLSRHDAARSEKRLADMTGFQQFVAEHGLGIFRNAFIVHLHGDPETLARGEAYVTDAVEQAGGQVRGDAYLQRPYFRAGQPGQGHRCPLFRPDHTWQVGDLLPVHVFSRGEAAPESVRLAETGQPVGLNYTNKSVAHSVTVAVTRGGKDVEKIATIVETYPFGIDWYCLEIGGSYRWVVEAFGGTYSEVDPRHTAVNPLPLYAVARAEGLPLDAEIAGATVNALAFLLTDGMTTLSVHQTAAAQMALQMLYSVPGATEAPTLADYLGELEQGTYWENDEQSHAAAAMAANLHSFLDTTEGRLFAGPGSLQLSDGITGVDLKAVDRVSPKLLTFYLVFVALRFQQQAFARRQPARVLLNELHKFVGVAPDVVRRLCAELARMGRKEAAALDLVTQGIAEIDALESEVLNSMAIRTLLYRNAEWETIAARMKLPEGALAAWKAFDYPLEAAYRPGLRGVGDAYSLLHLTFPSLLLDFASTDPADLSLKAQVGALTPDPFERIALLRQARAHGPAPDRRERAA